MKKEFKKQMEKKKKIGPNWSWIFKITVISFAISLIFSSLSEGIIANVNLVVSIIILLIFIALGILFDMIGVAVTSADEAPFHSMSSRKVKGAKTAVKFKKNADKVSSFCNDVIGDICGVISGTVGATIALGISSHFNLPLFVCSLIVTAIIASITIGGKATFKNIAINQSNEILYNFAKLVETFKK